ncbi:hypothetical protein Tco_1298556, partial [Tanacetum coccineum]
CPGSTFKTTISFGIFPIALLSISNIYVARTPAVAGKVPYLIALVALLSTLAIVVKMALGALGQRSPIRLLFTCPNIVDLGDILPLEGLIEYQLVDMFTKALPEDRFKYLVHRIGMRCLTPADLEVLTNENA